MRASLPSAARTEVQGKVAWIVQLVKIPFPSGTVLLTDHDAPVAYNGDTYQPGYIGKADKVRENANGTPETTTLELSGCDASLIAKCKGDDCHWINVKQYKAFLAGDATVLAVVPRFSGYLDSPQISMDEQKGSIVLSLVTIMAALKGKSQVLGTDADQQLLRGFATDTAFHYVQTNKLRTVDEGNKSSVPGLDHERGAGPPGSPTPGGAGAGSGGLISVPSPAPPIIMPITTVTQ